MSLHNLYQAGNLSTPRIIAPFAKKRTAVCVLLILSAQCFITDSYVTADEPSGSTVTEEVSRFLNRYCSDCHTGDEPEGGFNMKNLSSRIADQGKAEAWQEVLDALNAGEMPPEGEQQPPPATLAGVIGELTDVLFEARKRLVDTRQVTLRRLNKREYANTMRDLLGVQVNTSELPADGMVEGFDTIGDAHFMSTVQFERYLELARKALDRSLVGGARPERLVNRIEPENRSNFQARRALEKTSVSIEKLEAQLRNPKLDERGRFILERKLRSERTSVEHAKLYLSQPASESGYILGFASAAFPAGSRNATGVEASSRNGLPRKPDRNTFKRIALGQPIGRYIARIRVGLTCEPEPGQPLIVTIRHGGRVDVINSYRNVLGTFEISRTIDDPHVFEIPFDNPGVIYDGVSISFDPKSQISKATDSQPVRGKKAREKKAQAENAQEEKGETPDSTRTPRVWVDWLEMEGPFIDQWPPAAWTQTFFNGIPQSEPQGASRGSGKRGPTKTPAASALPLTTPQESEYAREVIKRFAFRAFRHREPDEVYLDRVHAIFTEYRDSGSSFVDAMKESLAVVLASPSFVYLVEQADPDDKSRRRLSDLELASRLSYFLWSHPPDETLYALAEERRLSQPAVLQQQVERMLSDPRADVFVETFISQWLDLPWLDMIVVNERRYPEFTEDIRSAFRTECVQFFSQLIRDNLTVASLIDSDFVMVNDVLAKFYGLDQQPEPQGASRGSSNREPTVTPAASALPLTTNRFRKVTLPADSVRGGLLGQGAILTMTSTGERTSPVERGVFVYERLLGRHVPPPPPNVPQLEISSEKPLTIRETLSAHVEKAQCASCHRRMDPLGFGLEHFDAIGKWREYEAVASGRSNARRRNGATIDATGVMPDGKRRFDGHEQLKQYLLQDVDGMAGGLARSMLTYALGRRVGFADADFLDAVQDKWKRNGYGMRELIHVIVQSDEFQTK